MNDVARWAKKVAEATRSRDEAVEKRDQAIREAHDEGATLREIAAAAGLSHTAIAKIVAKG